MISPIVVGLLGGVVVARLAMRRRMRWAGGCGGYARRWEGRRGFSRWAPTGVDGAKLAADKLSAQVTALELNARQKEELEEVFATIREQAGVGAVSQWPALERAFEAISGDEFEPGLVKDQPEKILDALEYLHNILTPEQRASLR
jgi:hypothetical protein